MDTPVDKRYKNIEYDSLYGLRYHLPEHSEALTLHCEVIDSQEVPIVSKDLPINLKEILEIYHKDGSSLHENKAENDKGTFVFMFALL